MMNHSSRPGGASWGLNTASFVTILLFNAVLFREEVSLLTGVDPDPHTVFSWQMIIGMLLLGLSQSRRIMHAAGWALAACIADYLWRPARLTLPKKRLWTQ